MILEQQTSTELAALTVYPCLMLTSAQWCLCLSLGGDLTGLATLTFLLSLSH